MPKSSDISALYDQFSGNADSFQEIGRTTRAAQASARWPLFSQMAQERGALVSSAGKQTPMNAMEHHQDEPALQATPTDIEPQLSPASLQHADEAVAPNLLDATPATDTSTTSWPAPDASPGFEASSPMKHERDWLHTSVQSVVATPAPNPASPPEQPPTAALPAVSRPPASALLPAQQTSPQVGVSPLRRLVRADPPAPPGDTSSHAPFLEDLTSVFSRLAEHPNKGRMR